MNHYQERNQILQLTYLRDRAANLSKLTYVLTVISPISALVSLKNDNLEGFWISLGTGIISGVINSYVYSKEKKLTGKIHLRKSDLNKTLIEEEVDQLLKKGISKIR